MRFRIYHAWLAQVPDGTAAEELPSLFDDDDNDDVGAISYLTFEVPAAVPELVARLACRGRLWEEGLVEEGAISFVQRVDV
jgi:hypothetical protein|tara:strand:+ start:101 stop:343 length:243 start_codon:yes stop_codon:yes gene_type:complete